MSTKLNDGGRGGDAEHAEHAVLAETELLGTFFEGGRLTATSFSADCSSCVASAYTWLDDLCLLGKELGLDDSEREALNTRLQTRIETTLFSADLLPTDLLPTDLLPTGLLPTDTDAAVVERKSREFWSASRARVVLTGGAAAAALAAVLVLMPAPKVIDGTENQAANVRTKVIEIDSTLSAELRFAPAALRSALERDQDVEAAALEQAAIDGLNFHRTALARCRDQHLAARPARARNAAPAHNRTLSLNFSLRLHIEGRTEVVSSSPGGPSSNCVRQVLKRSVLGLPSQVLAVDLTVRFLMLGRTSAPSDLKSPAEDE